MDNRNYTLGLNNGTKIILQTYAGDNLTLFGQQAGKSQPAFLASYCSPKDELKLPEGSDRKLLADYLRNFYASNTVQESTHSLVKKFIGRLESKPFHREIFPIRDINFEFGYSDDDPNDAYLRACTLGTNPILLFSYRAISGTPLAIENNFNLREMRGILEGFLHLKTVQIRVTASSVLASLPELQTDLEKILDAQVPQAKQAVQEEQNTTDEF